VHVTSHPYRLCELCSERQKGGGQVFDVVPVSECFVCAGLMDRTKSMASMAVKKARGYEFEKFAVGVSLPDGVQEREDELRATLKLKGNETIKTQVARLVADQVSSSLGKRVDKRKPDVTILANFGSDDVSVASRPAFYYGRYAKPAGISQRRTFCEQCGGSGCHKCRNTGFEQRPSVEDALREKLGRFSGSDKMIFTWLGSEDKASRVYPPGRPFIAEVKNPKKRRFPRKFGARLRGKLVSVSSGRVLASKPTKLPSFRFLTRIRATAASKVGLKGLAELRSKFRRTEVRFERPHNRPTMKMVYRVSATARGRTLLIDAELDGGLPVKRFVSGELVSPSVSEVLKTEVGCRSFDICGVREIGEFGFAEVTRDEEKN
jgi:tRNA pseudouridine synthase 10